MRTWGSIHIRIHSSSLRQHRTWLFSWSSCSHRLISFCRLVSDRWVWNVPPACFPVAGCFSNRLIPAAVSLFGKRPVLLQLVIHSRIERRSCNCHDKASVSDSSVRNLRRSISLFNCLWKWNFWWDIYWRGTTAWKNDRLWLSDPLRRKRLTLSPGCCMSTVGDRKTNRQNTTTSENIIIGGERHELHAYRMQTVVVMGLKGRKWKSFS